MSRYAVLTGRSASDALAQAAAKMLEAKFGEEVRIPPLPPAEPALLFVRARREAVYVGGYYRKLQRSASNDNEHQTDFCTTLCPPVVCVPDVRDDHASMGSELEPVSLRDISHSPFVIDGVRLGRTSIQEEIERVVLPHLRCDGSKFISAGTTWHPWKSQLLCLFDQLLCAPLAGVFSQSSLALYHLCRARARGYGCADARQWATLCAGDCQCARSDAGGSVLCQDGGLTEQIWSRRGGQETAASQQGCPKAYKGVHMPTLPSKKRMVVILLPLHAALTPSAFITVIKCAVGFLQGISASCTGGGMHAVQAGEQEKQKSYVARCWLPCPVTPAILDKISSTKDIMLQQRTPTRVEHRRAMLVGHLFCAKLSMHCT